MKKKKEVSQTKLATASLVQLPPPTATTTSSSSFQPAAAVHVSAIGVLMEQARGGRKVDETGLLLSRDVLGDILTMCMWCVCL